MGTLELTGLLPTPATPIILVAARHAEVTRELKAVKAA